MKKLFWFFQVSFIVISCSQINEAPQKVAFLGDSQVRNWDLDYWFPFNSNVNNGIPGYRASDLVNSIDETVPADRRIVWIGINDIIQLSQTYDSQTTIDSVLNSFRFLLGNLGTDDLVLPICPVTIGFDDQYLQDLNGIVYEVNSGLNAMCSETNLQFIDIAQPLTDGTCLKDAFTQDGLHLNNPGYEIISKKLLPFLY